MTIRQYFVIFAAASSTLLIALSLIWSPAIWLLVVLLAIIAIGVFDMLQTKHSIRRLYPVIGRFRYMLEAVRPEIQQYFVESDTSGTPIPREFRALIYQRSKGARDTRPFGTIFDTNRAGYEWVNHSLLAKHPKEHHPRVKFGGDQCTQPYMASPLNISAMSYGALSKNAIMALNKGAKKGGFSHNTGEGGLSPYHLEHGGDLVWQIGTGYFGCRDHDGNFNPELFRENAIRDAVKMIEIKLSQGAKPGHGGLLPAAKVTEEIAEIRNVPLGKDVLSPATHAMFSTPMGLLEFVQQLRELSGGNLPDFITIDGGEGGTGAAPVEMTNSVGTPIRDAVLFVDRTLIGAGLRDNIRLIASGKMFSAFHILRAMALGADTVNSARGMMLALGCIQSRACNTDHCPTGIATQNPHRNKGLVVTDKSERVANFHQETITNLAELVGAAGLDRLDQLGPEHINRRVQGTEVKTYAQLYPKIEAGSLLSEDTIPEDWKEDWQNANAQAW